MTLSRSRASICLLAQRPRPKVLRGGLDNLMTGIFPCPSSWRQVCSDLKTLTRRALEQEPGKEPTTFSDFHAPPVTTPQANVMIEYECVDQARILYADIVIFKLRSGSVSCTLVCSRPLHGPLAECATRERHNKMISGRGTPITSTISLRWSTSQRWGHRNTLTL